MPKRNNSNLLGFGARMAALRKAGGYTQEELAKKIKVSRRMIAYYEVETQHPPTSILSRLSAALNVTSDELLDDTRMKKTVIYHAQNPKSLRKLCVREIYNQNAIKIIQGDSRQALADIPAGTFQSCITSPPYWGLRDYGIAGQIGAENTPDTYIADLVKIFHEVRRTLRDDGTLWLNIGDSYTSGDRLWRAPDKKNVARAMSYRPPTPEGLKPKDLIGIPWRLAFALQQDGWYLRADIIWNKPNCQPESVKDRPTRSHEYVFLFSKSEKYYYDHEAIKESAAGGDVLKNRRTVWNVNTNGFHGAHFAVFPPELVRLCMLAGSGPGSQVLDPFFGSGTVGLVCREHQRQCVGIELSPDYVKIALDRLGQAQPSLPLYSLSNSH